MSKTVIGVFQSQTQAESAIRGLTEEGFDRKEISLVSGTGVQGSRSGSSSSSAGSGSSGSAGMTGSASMSGSAGMSAYSGMTGSSSGSAQDSSMSSSQNDPVGDGISTGSLIGGLGGLLLGAGALTIPGLGPVIAAGPLAAALTGAVTGGVAGGLLDLGIPSGRSQHYEQQVKSGKTLAVVRTRGDQVNDAAAIMRQHDARDVEIH